MSGPPDCVDRTTVETNRRHPGGPSMSRQRPDPDALLERVRAEEARDGRGSLRIFFGYAAGVGKTYSMLGAARRAAAAGRGVVVGYVEPHGRPETEALLEGLEAIPPRIVE